MYNELLSKKTIYLLLLVIGSNFLMFKKCGQSSPPPPPTPTTPSGTNQNPPQVKILPLELNNHLNKLGNGGNINGVSCLYDASLSQSIVVKVLYVDNNGLIQIYSSQTFTQSSLSTNNGDIFLNVNGLNVPTDGEFQITAEVTLECTVCCDKLAIQSAAMNDNLFDPSDGCDYNPISPPPPPNQGMGWGRPFLKLESPFYSGTAGNYTEKGSNVNITNFSFDLKEIKCICSC